MVQFLLTHQGNWPLAAIWLGGSYGRGEGAVWRHDEQERPCFDYDLYLIYERPDAIPDPAGLARLGESLASHVSMPVQLRSVGHQGVLHALEPRLLWYDLSLGHQVLWGKSELIPQLRGGPLLPAETGLNLLLHWGARLLALDPAAPNALDDWYRTAAALGDAWLIGLDAYQVSSQARVRHFDGWQRDYGPGWARELGYLYQEAMQYRLLPSDFEPMRCHLPARRAELVRLFVRVYLALFASQTGHELDLAAFEHLFFELNAPLPARPTAAQLRHLIANLRQYRGRSFHAGWYSRPLLHRLYFLLPFLLEGQLPAPATLARVLPDLPADATIEQATAHFQALMSQAGELI